jgi:hypothetical protein
VCACLSGGQCRERGENGPQGPTPSTVSAQLVESAVSQLFREFTEAKRMPGIN